MMRLATQLDRPLMRASGGRLRLSVVIPVLLLRVPGRKTGQLRSIPLLYVPDVRADDEGALILASNAGQGRLPAWYLNLRPLTQAEVVRSGETATLLVQELAGAEREEAWQKAVRLYPGYLAYQKCTTYPIPVIRLSLPRPD